MGVVEVNMRVRCIDNRGVEEYLTIGRLYHIITSRNKGKIYEIIDNENDSYLYPSIRFEEVEE